MKRKFKLLTSVASLCLAVALMAFGVYAAAQPKVTITGQVSFNATNVFATVEVWAGTGAQDKWTKVKTLTYDATQGNAEETVEIPAAEPGNVMNLTDTVTTCGYKVVITNNFTGTAKLNIAITDADITAKAGWTFGTVGEDGKTETGLAAGDSHTWGRTFTVDPAEASATFSYTINCVVDISRAAEVEA